MTSRSGPQSRGQNASDASSAAGSRQSTPQIGSSSSPSGQAPSSLGDDARAIEQLRQWRNRTDAGTPLDAPLARVIKDLSDRRRALRGADDAWASTVPAPFRERFRLLRVERGVLRVAIVDPHDSAAGYELDRWLRSGGLEALRIASKNVVKQVRPAS